MKRTVVFLLSVLLLVSVLMLWSSSNAFAVVDLAILQCAATTTSTNLGNITVTAFSMSSASFPVTIAEHDSCAEDLEKLLAAGFAMMNVQNLTTGSIVYTLVK
ncbi:MAG TPA: hypothetical protein DCP92_13005 [Nitrospiraceae bacterium]|jgi:hypothetical protein|nr:hypothetical protein [Nitrospiraceae bacterium]